MMELVEKIRKEKVPDPSMLAGSVLMDVKITPVTPDDAQSALIRSVGVIGTTLFTVDL